MAESRSDPLPRPLSPEILQTDRSPRHHKETQGIRNDIDENTSMDEVRAPNVFERVKEEIEALVETIHTKKEPPICERRDETVAVESKEGRTESQSDITVKAAKVFERAKDDIEKMLHVTKSHNQKETHGHRDDIGEDTPLNEVKAPSVFEQAMEEYEAFIQTFHFKKESQTFDKRDEAANAAVMQKKTVLLSENDAEIRSNDKPPNWNYNGTQKMLINEVKGPNVFERAKDEMEALVHTIHHKKEADSPAKEGFMSKLGSCLEILCSPSKEKGD